MISQSIFSTEKYSTDFCFCCCCCWARPNSMSEITVYKNSFLFCWHGTEKTVETILFVFSEKPSRTFETGHRLISLEIGAVVFEKVQRDYPTQ